ncbi:DNA integrity scanning diadenylate cyclase DisA [Candidatus Hydrogenedentota bacterium]
MTPRKETGETVDEKTFEHALRLMAPGTSLREGLAAILQSHRGGLIILGGGKNVLDATEGGFKINVPFTPTKLYELAKMDGAILLDEEAEKISFANLFVAVGGDIESTETGARHRAAQKLARKTGVAVIAVSERKSTFTLYAGHLKRVLENIHTVLNKANQTLATLEKYLSATEIAIDELSVHEFQDVVTLNDICYVVQRAEMANRIEREVRAYGLYLGEEGRLIALQLHELKLESDIIMTIIKDYAEKTSDSALQKMRAEVGALSQQDLLDPGRVAATLGFKATEKSTDTYFTPRGYRILSQTQGLSESVIENLVSEFGSLQSILRARRDQLVKIDGVGDILAERIKVGLNMLRNQLIMDRGELGARPDSGR